MKSIRIGLKHLCVLLLLVSLVVLPSTCSAAGYYRLTEEEMAVLDHSLSRLSSNLQLSKKESQNLRKESQELKKELALLKTSAATQQSLLSAANKSLETQRNEEKRRSKILKAQRTLWQIIAVGSLYFVFAK